MSPKDRRLSPTHAAIVGALGGLDRNEPTVAPEQVTTTTAGQMQARAICHWLIDQLPVRAYGELLAALLDMRGYYSVGASAHPRLGGTKPLKRLTRTTRPEVDFSEE